MTEVPKFSSFSTDAIHEGIYPDPHTGAVMPNICLSTTFAQKSPGHHYPGDFEYSRTANPTRNAFEANVAKLESAQYGIAFSSGVAAISTVIQLLKPGDEVICCDDVYGGTRRFFTKAAELNQVQFHYVDMNNESLLKKTLSEKTKMVWIESPTNPTMKITDIRMVSELFSKDVLIAVDNTFLSPYFMRPLMLGANIVVHSVTKYINGHSDVLGGFVATNDSDVAKKLRFLQNACGAVLSPFDSYMAMRGVKTLALRMQAHERNAMAVAEFLEKHEKVKMIRYPGLACHPHHHIAKKQQTGFGGMITFWLKGGLDESQTFLENLKLFALAESLGGVESLAEHPAIMTHASVPLKEREKLGISDSLIRLSIGIEDVEDIINDINQALDAVN